MKLVVDTSILIDHLRGGNEWQKFILSLQTEATFCVPTIVFFELLSGASTRRKEIKQKITDFLKNFERIELTEPIAGRGGEIFRDDTRDLSVPDYIVAASALEIGGAVVTLNHKHFRRIPGLLLYPQPR